MSQSGRTGCSMVVGVLIAVVLIYVAAMAALRGRTEFGKCVGLNGPEKPGLVYSYDTRNIVIGVAAFQSIILPVYVVLERMKCPTAKAAP